MKGLGSCKRDLPHSLAFQPIYWRSSKHAAASTCAAASCTPSRGGHPDLSYSVLQSDFSVGLNAGKPVNMAVQSGP